MRKLTSCCIATTALLALTLSAHASPGSTVARAASLYSALGVGPVILVVDENDIKGTSNNCHRSSGAPNLSANDSALFSFRFCAVHPKDVRNCPPQQLFEVPTSRINDLAP